MTKISFCGTIKKGEDISETLKSIKNQSKKPDEIIVTDEGNIAQGRNEYLTKAKGDIVFTFDSGCIYEKDYIKNMLECFKDKKVDIVAGVVLPQNPKSLIQEFCSLRMPQYFRFTKDDWNQFIPSNRQVAFRRSVVKKLGLLPEYLSRADDTYWFGLAKQKRLKFAHCNAICYWETKKTLKDYLRTVYLDSKIDKKFKIKSCRSPQKISPKLFPYGTFVSCLALIVKIISKL
jgi:cellulose synthase/poly-beta-1,6-N-acetylglucosamine synthase-like glycosyltransferase